jgi:rhodanese-related sulfurtransferase
MSKEESSQRLCRSYQSCFPDIRSISSHDFTTSFLLAPKPFVLVDVRTLSERRISMLEGAVPLKDFNRTSISLLPSDVRVITYCTVGYRSGLEARRLKNRFGLEGRIYHLDGIVAYTHALPAIDQHRQSNHQGKVPQPTTESNDCNPEFTATRVPRIINPQTGEETRRVHTFGSGWDNLCYGYDGVHFSFPLLVIGILRVCILVVIRFVQEFPYRCQCNNTF